jgi:hypothetical protein
MMLRLSILDENMARKCVTGARNEPAEAIQLLGTQTLGELDAEGGIGADSAIGRSE